MPMRNVPIKLPDGLDRQLTAIAKQQRTTRSRVLRQALEAFINENRKTPPRTRQTIGMLAADLIGSVEGPGDLTTNPKYMADYGK